MLDLLGSRVSAAGPYLAVLPAGDVKDPLRVLFLVRVSAAGLCLAVLPAGDVKDPLRVLFLVEEAGNRALDDVGNR
jgi:hypothetical protein